MYWTYHGNYYRKWEDARNKVVVLRGLLRRIEADEEYCPICERNLYADLRDKSLMGHADDCELAEELKAVEE